jgi:hypothetical protein
MARLLDGSSQGVLVAIAGAGAPSGLNLAAVGYEAVQHGRIFIVYALYLAGTERAKFALGGVFAAPAARAPSGGGGFSWTPGSATIFISLILSYFLNTGQRKAAPVACGQLIFRQYCRACD